MKKITLIILFVLFQFSHHAVFGSDGSSEDKELSSGFFRIQYKGEGKNKEWVYFFDYKEMEELYKDFLKNATNGVPFNENEKLKYIISETLNEGINHQLETLKGCMGADYAKKIEDKVKTGEIDLRFDDAYGIHNGYHEEETGEAKENITLSGSYLEKIITDITSSIKNNEKWYPDNIYTLPYYTDFLTDMGHEMIHTHAGIGGGQTAECLAHCFTRQCLNSNHDPRDFQYSVYQNLVTNRLDCNQLDFPPEIEKKMGEGKCFCGVNWEDRSDNEPCKDEDEESTPTPPQDGSSVGDGGGSHSGGSREYEHSDNGDENFSSASAILTLANTTLAAEDFFLPPGKDFLSLSYYPDLLIYNKFNYPDMPRLLDRFEGFDYIHDYIHDYFSNHHKVLVIPSGELMGDSGSKILKQSLKNFVENGGVILCLAQQYDFDLNGKSGIKTS